MSKFNTSPETSKTVSYEGGTVFNSSHEFELYSLVVTEFIDDKYYESKDARLSRLRTLVENANPEFVMKLAVYAREEMHLRSVPLYLLVLLNTVKPAVSMHHALTRVIQRADELTETLACYNLLKTHKNKSIKPVSHQVLKGVKNAFLKFDEYQLAKWNSKKEFTLKDVVRLSHPKPKTDAESELLKKVVTDSLSTPYTWETQLSELGKQQYETPSEKKEAFRNKWVELINSGKIGYMALLRNLRNILEYDVPLETIETVAKIIENEEAVVKSKQFPFRFYSAAKSIEDIQSVGTSRLIQSIDNALGISIKNITFFSELDSVMFACDTSGSMSTPVSKQSVINYVDVGAILAAIAQKVTKYHSTYVFATSMSQVRVSTGSALQAANSIISAGRNVGYGTDFEQVLRHALNNRTSYTKICVFTDVQINSLGRSVNTLWNEYRKTVNPDAKLYVFDLTGYGKMFTPMHDSSAIQVSGWSDKVFDMIQYIENKNEFIDKINSIEI